MPAVLPTDDLERAKVAVAYAEQVRKHHAKQTDRGSPQRQADIKLALDRLRDAMVPLRSAIGRFPYGPQTETAENNRETIREASLAIQKERRKLWKMQRKENDA